MKFSSLSGEIIAGLASMTALAYSGVWRSPGTMVGSQVLM